MRVQRVVMPDGAESWTVLDVEQGVVEPVESFLAHLSATERSPNTVRAYAQDLRDFFAYLQGRRLDWRGMRLEDLGGYVAWLRLPPGARDGHVAALPTAEHHCSPATVNRKLSALSSFYLFHERHGIEVGELLTTGRPVGRGGSWKPLLAHLGPSPRARGRTISLRTERRTPRELATAEVEALLEACGHLRDRLLITVLRRTGLRIGEALGLRHEDIHSADGNLVVRRRANANGARAKTWSRTVPVEAAVVRLYADYLHQEYGPLDSDYVFVNLWGHPHGHPMTYATAHGLVQRLSARAGVPFTAHQLRHTYATDLLRRGTPAEVVQKLLGHASIATTIDTYSHLGVEDSRRALVAAGFDLAGPGR